MTAPTHHEHPYQRIAGELRDRITSGVLAPGDLTPSGAAITREWGVAVGTANRALALLHAWGLVETVTGVGTRVVAQPPASGPAEHTARLRAGQPIYAPGERSVITEAGIITTDVVAHDVLRAAGLPVPPEDMAGEATTIVKRARVLYSGEHVTGLCRTWYPHPLIAQQGRRGVEVLDRLINVERIPGGTAHLLTDLYGVDITHETTRAGVRRLPPALAYELGVDPGTPALRLLVTRLADDYVIEVDEWFRLTDVVLG